MSESRLYSFINNQHGFTINLIDGHKLIQEISKIHNIGPFALPFYEKTLLSSQQMINFLKPGESLGFYIDSEEPYFRFKIEMSHGGSLRTLLLPEEFSEFPTHFTGKCRINKIYGNKLNFFIDDVEKIIFDSSKQTTIETYLQEDKLQTLKDSLININNYLQSGFLGAKRIKDLKKLRIKFKKQINDIENQMVNNPSSNSSQLELWSAS